MKDNKKIIYFIFGLLILIILGLVLFIIFGLSSDKSNSIKTDYLDEVSQANSEFNISMEEQYDDILDQFFGIESLELYAYDNLARYPVAYQDIMIDLDGYVEKVLEEKDNHYKILVRFLDYENYYGIYNEDKYFVIEGEYGNFRYLKNDFIRVYGVYKGNATYSVDGDNEVLPKINAVKVLVANAVGEFEQFSQDELREVADAFFETTYTLTKPSYVCDNNNPLGCYLMGFSFHYLITLDNNSNSRFNTYRIYPSGGRIDVATEQDSEDLKRFISKSSDRKKFILSTYTKSNDYLELQLYDKDFKLIWTRKFENAGNYLYDNNNGRIALSIDNDLYLIDEKTGEDIVAPLMTVDGNSLKLLANGDVILVGQSAKDFIMYIKSDGKVEWKTSLSTYDGEYHNKIDGTHAILVANEKIYVGFFINDFSNTHVVVFSQTGEELVNTFANPKN